jgi:pyruvate/2-oxoglutarate dehydrogenase complex dihydrolipoamide acyltransferase (E2) component
MSSYQTVPFPKHRRLVRDFWVVNRAYTMRGLLEIDVTEPRRIINEHKARTGERLSFTAFLAKCVAQAVSNHKHVQAIPNWRGDLVIFDDVDIGTLIEREAHGEKYPLAHVIRAADKKILREIHDEIREAQANPPTDKEAGTLNLVTSLPTIIRRAVVWAAVKSPQMRKDQMGTVSLSAVGMFGSKSGWGMVPSFHSLALVVGGIVQKPGAVDGRIELREYLSLTIDFDHNIIDGAPAARFARDLADLIESSYGLDDLG